MGPVLVGDLGYLYLFLNKFIRRPVHGEKIHSAGQIGGGELDIARAAGTFFHRPGERVHIVVTIGFVASPVTAWLLPGSVSEVALLIVASCTILSVA